MKNINNHTFAICAYKKSPYLEDCIKSIINQTVKSKIIMVTATPNKYISDLAQKYQIKLYINKKSSDIQTNWNFGYHKAKTKFVTIVHQDDLYDKNFLAKTLKRFKKNNVIIFTNYNEFIENSIQRNFKKTLRNIVNPIFAINCLKKFLLSFWNPICCPSVTFNKDKVGNRPFTSSCKYLFDWDTWIKLSEISGRFSYIPNVLVLHRLHEDTETYRSQQANIGYPETYEMLKKNWPNFIVKLLMKVRGK